MPEEEDDFDPVANAADVEQGGASVAKSLLKAEMKKRNLSYSALADFLTEYGIYENERNLRNKVSRGTFSAGWFFGMMMMLGVKTIDLSHLYTPRDDLW